MASEDDKLPELTEKQMNFVLGKQKGLSNAEAYRQSYNTGSMQPQSIWTKAAEVASNGKVRVWLAHISSERIKEDVTEAKYTKQRYLDDLAEVAQVCKENQAWSSYYKATEALGKAMGHIVSLSESTITRKADIDLLDKIEHELGTEARTRAEHKMGLH